MPDTTLAEHAEAWWREQGKEVSRRNTKEWQRMYETWVAWAFSDLHGQDKPRSRKRRDGR